ncbi:MAG: sulfotransferase family protein [Acidimicrobiales bacterium]
MLPQPILLVGAERSGSTMLRLMLDSHPEIAFGEEFEWAVQQIADDGSWPDMAAFKACLETSRPFQTSGFVVDETKTYPDLISSFLEQRRAAKGAEIVGATVHFGFEKALKLWPDAKLIHLLRDPRDVAPSCVAMGWAGNLWFGLDAWIDAEDEWSRVLSGLHDDQHITVRFEELLVDHLNVLSEICRFVGVTYHEHMLDYATTTDYELPQPDRAQGWRTTLSDRDVQLIEARAGARLVERGFEPSGLPPLELADHRRRWLGWHDRAGRIRFRVDRFGPRLTAEEMASRALGRDHWHRSTRRRMMAIEMAHLKKSWADGVDGRSSR